MKVKGWSHKERLTRALDENRVLKVTYTSVMYDETTVREIEPVYATTCHLGKTLIVAYCRLRGDYRTFRLDRVENSLLKYEEYNPTDHLRKVVGFIASKVDSLGELNRLVRRYNLEVMNV